MHDMKLIMETFRVFSEEKKISDEEMQQMLQQAAQDLGLVGLNEDQADKLFRGLVLGGLMTIAPMIYGIYSHEAENSARFRAAAEQAAQRLSSTETKIAELNKQVNDNTAPWQWSDDTLEDPATGEKYKSPHSTERFPTVDFDQDGQADAIVLSPSWSIAMQVLQDKQAGTINVPGYAEGEVPSLGVILTAINVAPAEKHLLL